MKHTKYLLTAISALGLPALALADTTLHQAQITKIVKDVKTVDPAKGARPAVMQETLQGEQSVKTGIDSRTELLFNDHTITRLGANTHFSFSEGTRNMSLGSGVMLLQVPKGIGGAKIETAAVTAAVTGTTIMIEAGKDYTKAIVLEGELCLWPRSKKDEKSKLFKMRHKVCIEAGQEVILRNGSKEIPDPVYVNLRILEQTSKLITGSWGTDLNHGPIDAAKDGQGPADYIPTNLAIIGAGTDVVIIQQQDPPGPPDSGNPPPPPAGGGNPALPPGKYGALQVIPGNPYVIGGGSVINTDPTIKTGGVTSYGRIYRGSILDGPPADYLFGAASGVSNSDFDFAFVDASGHLFPNYGVAAYKFANLLLNGMPAISYNENGATDIAFISEGAINIASASSTMLDFQGQLHNLLFASSGGSINMNSNMTIQGLTGGLEFYNIGAANNITLDGFVNLPGGRFTASTQGAFGGSGFIDAQSINISAGGTVTLNEITGEGNIDTVNGVQFNVNDLYNLSLTANAINIPGGFTGAPPLSEGATVALQLYAHSNGSTLPGDVTLSGDMLVYDLFVSAEHNFTSDNNLNLSSDYNVQIYTGNDITADGFISADNITLSGHNVSTLSASGCTSFDARDAIEIDSTNDTTISNSLFAPNNVNVTAGNNITVTGSATIGAGNISLTANNVIQIDGFIGGGEGSASSFTADTTGGGGPISGQDFFGSGTTGAIDADTITVKSRGDLALGTDINTNLVLNQVNVNPNGGLSELDLSGATIEIGTVNPSSSITLKAISIGDLTITGNITVGEFNITVGGALLSGTGHTVTAGNVSLRVNSNDFSLQDGGSGLLILTNMTSGLSGGPHILGFQMSGSSSKFTIAGNSLTVTDISSISGLSLGLTSATDINGGPTPSQAFISNATGVALKVGVNATLAGDSSGGIYYNNSALLEGNPSLPAQLYVGIGSLTYFSMEANSITVNNGFPTVNGSVNLTADNGDITLNTVFSTTNGDATLVASGKIDVEHDVDIGGNANFTANGGDIILNGTAGGSLTTINDANLTASGNINIGHDLNIGGSANFDAGGNITIEDASSEPILSISGGLTLTSGGAGEIVINNEIDINGSLNLSGGTDIRTTNTAGVIFGATDVTLSLNTAAQLSVSSGTLIFTPTGGTTPVPIDMASVTSVTATGSSLTLASAFNDAIDLDLTASNGNLLINGAITANYVTLTSFNGDTTVAQPVNAIGFSAEAIGGNLIFNAPITTTSYVFAFATAGISGTGAITSPDVSLSQGNAATVTQSGTTLFFGTVPVNLDTTSGGAASLSLSAGPLQLGGDLTLTTASLSLSGMVNSQNHSITAEFVTLRNVQTVTDASGNATNLTITGADGIEFSGGNVGFALVQNNEISSGTSVALTGAMGTQGSGGTLTATTTSPTNGEGQGDINVDGVINANGADAHPGSGKAGGNGGTVNLTSAAGIYLYDNVYATSGINSNTTFPGGNGGTVNLTAQDQVYVNSTVEVSSSDLVKNRVSAKGGNVNITSHAATGVAINIDSSGQINSLLNQAAPGPGGTITFVADKGGDIVVKGKVRADAGTVNILNTGTATGNVSFDGASLAGNVIKAQTLSPNGTITVGNSMINADTAIKLYAVGSNGTVDFVANTFLSGNSVKSIAGNTVKIEQNVNVNVTGGPATVYTNNALYQGSGGTGGVNTGHFTGNGATTAAFASRPAF